MDYDAIRVIKRILEDCMMRVEASREKQVCNGSLEFFMRNYHHNCYIFPFSLLLRDVGVVGVYKDDNMIGHLSGVM